MSFFEKLLKENKHVHIHEDKRDFVEQTIHSLIHDGRRMLHIVADFDFTLTMYDKDGETLPTTYAIIENDQRVRLPDDSIYGNHANQLLLKYYPIANDFEMSMEEKIPHMVKWYDQVHSLILSSNLNQTMLQELVHHSKMELRKGVQEFITELLRSQTPILIFSAGLGDIIEIFLRKEIPEFKHNHESSHIVSNFIEFDANGKLIAFRKNLIHSLNKNEYEIHDTPYYQSILNRPNIILLGDAVGDVGMTAEMKNLKHILKIGYLNHSTPSKLEVYKNFYDIIICDDKTFDVPNMILNVI